MKEKLKTFISLLSLIVILFEALIFWPEDRRREVAQELIDMFDETTMY